MMTTLRSQMKLILWILVIAFLATIVFSWGMGGFKGKGAKPGVLGEIDGFEITADAFEYVVDRKVTGAAARGEEAPEGDKLKQLREDTWDEQVDAVLKRNLAKKLRLTVTDPEVAWVVENNPPPEVMNADVFKTEGKFDLNKYRQFLRDPGATQFLLSFEESVRNFLMEQLLTFYVQLSADVTEDEVRDQWIAQNIRGKLRFIFIPFSESPADSAMVTEEMKRRYYQLFKERYKVFGQRRFAYVKFKTEPTAQDSAEVRKRADELLAELKAGADFAKLAEQFSQDAGSAAKGGDLDWFGRGAMVKPFEDAVFAAQVGDLVGPVESKFGLHIIKVEGRRVQDGEPQVKARHILLKMEPSAETRDQVYEDASTFAKAAQEDGFEAAVQTFDYQVDTTGRFSESGYIAGLGRMRMAAEFCFKNPVGTVSEVFNVPDGYVVFKIVEATEDGYKPYEEVQASIGRAILKVLRQHKAQDEASRLRGQMGGPADLERVAAQEGLKVYVTADSSRPTDALPEGLGRDREFTTQAFRLEKGELSDVIVGKNGCYIAAMEDRTPFDQEVYNSVHFAIYKELLTKKQQSAVDEWKRELRLAADIKDYRYLYYRDF